MKKAVSLLIICIIIFACKLSGSFAYEDYRAWSQSDSRWGSITLGGYYSMSSEGCLVTSVSKLIVQAGLRSSSEFNPGIFVNWLNNNSGFTYGALYWGKPSAYGLSNSGHLVASKNEACGNYTSQIINWINQGYHLVIGVNPYWDSNNNCYQARHWVAVDEILTKQKNDVYIMDSTNGTNVGVRLVDRYARLAYIHGFTGGTSPSAEIRGSVMSEGYDRAIPDGDYLIVAAGASNKSTFYYLDIEGTARPAANDTNVSLCGPLSGDPPIYEIWTVTYNSSDKFYTIKQKGTNMCLDVHCADTLQGTNVKAYTSNNCNAQKWAIERDGSIGYRLRPKCSGGGNSPQCLDICDGKISNGTQVRQWSVNNSTAQSWLFIPYMPSQPISEGRYALLYGGDNTYELDVPGNTADVANNTAVQVWSDAAQSQYNSFDFIQLSNGYYKVKHAASGLCLDVTNGSNKYKSSAVLHDDNGSASQQWAIMTNGSGYSLVSKCNGYALDLPNGTTGNGKTLEVYPRLTNTNQRWSFVRAEYDIRYSITEGEGGPENQVKYYKTNLVLSTEIPTRSGYEFVCWEDRLSLDDSLNTTKYYPGDTLTRDDSLVLYPVWHQITYNYIINYNANGGTAAPSEQHVTSATAILSSEHPQRKHYVFLGWATNSSATAAVYQPGDTYTGGVSITLYAVWQHKTDNLVILPEALTEIESEAFVGTLADAFVIPCTVTAIGANAFDDVVIYGYKGSCAEYYANDNGLTFIPITDQWVLEDNVPAGAHVTDEKWTYTLTTTETTTSTATSMPGWTQNGYTWQQTGTGTWNYANFPSGFDTGSGIYSKYNRSAIGNTSTDTTKRVVESSTSLLTYIYWHWTFSDYVEDSNRNVIIEDSRKLGVNISGSVYRDFIYFDAFETAASLSQEGMATGGLKIFDGLWSTYHHPEYNLPEYASWWWYRFEVYQQTYTDFQKLFTYVKNNAEILESPTRVVPGDGITNVQRWVRYSF